MYYVDVISARTPKCHPFIIRLPRASSLSTKLSLAAVKGTLQWFTRNACVGCQCSITGIRRTHFFPVDVRNENLQFIKKKKCFPEIFSFKHQSTKISISRWRCLLMPCLRRNEVGARKKVRIRELLILPCLDRIPYYLLYNCSYHFPFFFAAVRQMPFDKENRGKKFANSTHVSFSPALECVLPPKYFIAPKSNSGARRRNTQKGKEWLQESCFVWIQSKSFTSSL